MLARSANADAARLAGYAALILLALAPMLWVDIPAMLDYPNHMTRMHLIAGLASGEVVSPFYQLRWLLLPNLAMDLIVPPMAQLIGAVAATKVFLAFAFALNVSGVIALERVVKGHVGAAGLVALAALYNKPFAFGFVNFTAAMGVATWGFAAWIALRDRAWPLRLIVHSVIVVALLAGHLFALGIYGAAVGAYELWRLFEFRPRLKSAAADWALLAAPPAVAFLVLATSGVVGGSGIAWNLYRKFADGLTIINGYDNRIGIASLLIFLLLAAVLFLSRAARMHPAAPWIAGVIGALYLLLPSTLVGNGMADARILVAFAFFVPAFIFWELRSDRVRALALGTVALVIAANHGAAANAWISFREDYAELKSAFSDIPRQSKVLAAAYGTKSAAEVLQLKLLPMVHAPVLAVMYADAFVPTLFTHPGKQLIAVRPEYQRLDTPEGFPVTEDMLVAARKGSLSADESGPEPYWKSWAQDFEFLVMLGSARHNLAPDILEPVLTGRRFVLFRIAKAG